MSLSLATLLRNARADAITAFLGAAPLIRIYNGTKPAAGGAVTTLLAQLTMNATPFPAASAGVLTANAISSQLSAANTGAAAWFRIVKADGTYVIDGTVSTVTAATGDLRLDDVNIVQGGTVAISSAVLNEGNP